MRPMELVSARIPRFAPFGEPAKIRCEYYLLPRGRHRA